MIEATKTHHVRVRASAGSGKTYRLTQRILELLAADVPAAKILASTFTKKAAGEILERLLLRLARMTLGEDLEQAAGLGLSPERAGDLLARVTQELSRLRIATIDAFTVEIAQSYAIELDLVPEFRLADEWAEAELQSQALESLFERDGPDPDSALTLLRLLNKGEVPRSFRRELLSDLSTFYRIYLEAPDPNRWAALSQDPLGPTPNLDRVLSRLGKIEIPRAQNGRPLKHWERSISQLREHLGRGNLQPLIRMTLVEKIARGEDEFARAQIPTPFRRLLKPLVDYVLRWELDHIAKQTRATHDFLSRYHRELERVKASRAIYTFEDLTHRVAQAQKNQQLEELSFRLDGQIDHLLLDEFQDTSRDQWKILAPIAEELSAYGPERSIFVVGDPKQSIYGWRGGVPEILDYLDRDLPQLSDEQLEKSYRSSPAVIEAVNTIFREDNLLAALDEDPETVRAWSSNFAGHATVVEKPIGYVSLVTAPDQDKSAPGDDSVLIKSAQLVSDFVDDAPDASIGVLCRRNHTVGRVIGLLSELGIQASEEGGNPLTDSVAVELFLALLRCVDQPSDSISEFHWKSGPFSRQLLPDPDGWLRWLSQLSSQLLERGYAQTLTQLIDRVSGSLPTRDLNRLDQFILLAAQYEGEGRLSTRPLDFVHYALAQRVENPDSHPVRVMNIHQSKGLEFDIVVACELDQSIFDGHNALLTLREDPMHAPLAVYRSAAEIVRNQDVGFAEASHQDRAAQIRESLSLLYVALTRAKRQLTMVVHAAPKQSSLPRTFAGLIRRALVGETGAAPANALLFESGERLAPTSESRTAKRSGRRQKVRVGRVSDRAKAERVRLTRETPSHLESENPLRGPLASPFNPKSLEAQIRGRAVHAALELIEWQSDDNPKIDLPVDGPGLGEAVTREVFTRTGVLETLRETGVFSDSELEEYEARLSFRVERELPFCRREGSQFISGVVDRVVLVERNGAPAAAQIVDFKTDLIDRDEIKSRADLHAPQLEFYRRGLASHFGLAADRIALSLAFITPDACLHWR